MMAVQENLQAPLQAWHQVAEAVQVLLVMIHPTQMVQLDIMVVQLMVVMVQLDSQTKLELEFYT